MRAALLILPLSVLAVSSGCQRLARRACAPIVTPFPSAMPDVSTRGGKVWFVERTQAVGAYAAELNEPVPLQFRPQRTLRLFVLSGRARVRLGGREEFLGPGSFVSVPPRTSYRLVPLGAERPRLRMFLAPDGNDSVVIEIPSISRRLAAGDRR